MTDFFAINDVWHKGQVLSLVGWDEKRGTIKKAQNIKVIWDLAFETGSDQVTFFDGTRTVTINASLHYMSNDPHELLINGLTSITGVAFCTRSQAEQFVDELEKRIAWKLLKSEIYA